jgi:hypothetical protein
MKARWPTIAARLIFPGLLMALAAGGHAANAASGSSGQWEYEQYLRLACEAILPAAGHKE